MIQCYDDPPSSNHKFTTHVAAQTLVYHRRPIEPRVIQEQTIFVSSSAGRLQPFARRQPMHLLPCSQQPRQSSNQSASLTPSHAIRQLLLTSNVLSTDITIPTSLLEAIAADVATFCVDQFDRSLRMRGLYPSRSRLLISHHS